MKLGLKAKGVRSSSPKVKDAELNWLLNEGVGFVTWKRLEYMEGNHCLLLCATEKV